MLGYLQYILVYIFRDIGKEEEEEEREEEPVFARDKLMKCKQNSGFPFR